MIFGTCGWTIRYRWKPWFSVEGRMLLYRMIQEKVKDCCPRSIPSCKALKTEEDLQEVAGAMRDCIVAANMELSQELSVLVKPPLGEKGI